MFVFFQCNFHSPLGSVVEILHLHRRISSRFLRKSEIEQKNKQAVENEDLDSEHQKKRTNGSFHETERIQAASFILKMNDLLVKTSLKDRSRAQIGPFCCAVDLEAKWSRRSGNPGPEKCLSKLLI
ncbi:UNVERIFIED_CONTAM: hypothetical protein FKN15_048779 [Acipenser sinensis]